MCMLAFYILNYRFFVTVRYRSRIIVASPTIKVIKTSIPFQPTTCTTFNILHQGGKSHSLVKVNKHVDVVLYATYTQQSTFTFSKFFPNETIKMFTLVEWQCHATFFRAEHDMIIC